VVKIKFLDDIKEEIAYRVEIFNYSVRGKSPKATGKTGFSSIKMFAVVFLLPILIIGGYFSLPYLVLHHNSPVTLMNTTQQFNGNGIPSGITFVHTMTDYVYTMPNVQALSSASATISPTINPLDGIPSPTAYPQQVTGTSPVNPGDPGYGVNLNGAIPCPTPKPYIAENGIVLNSNNWIKVDHMNVDYPLTANRQLTTGQTIPLSIKIANLEGTPIKHINLVVSVVAYGTAWGESTQSMLYTKSIDYGSVNIASYDYYTINYNAVVPPVTGHYNLELAIDCDNGANAQIMQEITIT
jgi:hypothetical protein